jgi:hypothetical protein
MPVGGKELVPGDDAVLTSRQFVDADYASHTEE